MTAQSKYKLFDKFQSRVDAKACNLPCLCMIDSSDSPKSATPADFLAANIEANGVFHDLSTTQERQLCLSCAVQN